MAQKKVKTRIQNKSDTKANWSTANDNNFVPLKGEVVLYQTLGGTVGGLGGRTPLIKIGDGTTKVGTLEFINIDRITNDYSMCLNEDRHYTLVKQTSVDSTGAPNYMHNAYLYSPLDSSTSALDNLPNNAHIKSTCLLVFDGVTTTKFGRTFPVSLTISKRQQDVLNLYVYPDKCLCPQWTLAETVSNASPSISISANNYNTYVMFTVTLPEDKDSQGNYLYNSGFATVDIDLYKITNELVYITVTPKLSVGN